MANAVRTSLDVHRMRVQTAINTPSPTMGKASMMRQVARERNEATA